MIRLLTYILLLTVINVTTVYSQDERTTISRKDTTYTSIANTTILKMLKPGKAPRVTLQLSFNYNIGHLDLAGNENTVFRKDEFASGGNFGTRYGYGVSLTGKIALHKDGNVRLNVTTAFNRMQSNFVISESPEGKVHYNVLQGGIGIENNFTPAKKFKPYVGFELLTSMISGEAVLTTDSTDFTVNIKNSVRFGLIVNFGFEYAFNDKVGMNLGYKLTHANLIGKDAKASDNPAETTLNDDKVPDNVIVPYGGWKQFMYSSFYAGINFYFGMKNKK